MSCILNIIVSFTAREKCIIYSKIMNALMATCIGKHFNILENYLFICYSWTRVFHILFERKISKFNRNKSNRLSNNKCIRWILNVSSSPRGTCRPSAQYKTNSMCPGQSQFIVEYCWFKRKLAWKVLPRCRFLHWADALRCCADFVPHGPSPVSGRTFTKC